MNGNDGNDAVNFGFYLIYAIKTINVKLNNIKQRCDIMIMNAANSYLTMNVKIRRFDFTIFLRS